MDDVGAPELAEEERPIPELRDQRSHELDGEQAVEGRAGDRIYRDNPRLDVRVSCPAVEQALRLHRLASQDAQGGDDDGHSETMRFTHYGWARVPPAEVQVA